MSIDYCTHCDEKYDQDYVDHTCESLNFRFTCNRCNAEWWPAKPETPQTCPKCRSPYWDKQRKKPLNKSK